MARIGFERPHAHPIRIPVRRAEASDVDRPEIERLFAVRRPFRQRHAGAARRRDAESVKTGADEEIAHLRRFADHPIAVGREAFEAVDHLLDAGLGERGHAAERETS